MQRDEEVAMPRHTFPLAKQIDRVLSMTVPLDAAQEKRFQRLMEEVVMVDLHEHPLVWPASPEHFVEYLHHGDYQWGYQAVRHGGWAAVATANVFRGMVRSPDISAIAFDDLVDEIGMMLADLRQHPEAVKVTNADDIVNARQQGKVGILPTVEHLAIGESLHHVDVLYALGVRIAGLTYNRQNAIGAGLRERHDPGLSAFGIEVVRRMNDLGMAVDVSHAGFRTAMDAITHSHAPIIYSHNAAHALWPTWRTRQDEELVACARKGGLIAITAVPNSLSDDPRQTIHCVLDHYDYMVRLVGAEHVAIGTDTLVGDHVGFHCTMMGTDRATLPAPYLDGLESPADGQNILRGLIVRGHSDEHIKQIAGGNALNFFRRVMA
jgi:membrane dipeptidase